MNLIHIIDHIDPKAQLPELFYPVDLQRAGFLTGSLHFREGYFPAIKQQQPVRHPVETRAHKLQG